MLLVNSNSIVKLYAYGTNSHTICVRSYHMHIRVRYVPCVYGMKYVYGTQHCSRLTTYFRRPGIKLNIHFYMITMLHSLYHGICVSLSHKPHIHMTIGTVGSELTRLPLKP